MRWTISIGGGIHPQGRADGRELYYIAPNSDLMAVTIAARDSTIGPGTPVSLFRTRIVGSGAESLQSWQYDVTRDAAF